jgi:hypothetical protein
MSKIVITYIPENINTEIIRLPHEKGLVPLGSIGRFVDEDGTAYHMQVADPVAPSVQNSNQGHLSHVAAFDLQERLMKVWFDILTKKDARELKKWWNANSKKNFEEYTIERSPTNRKYWALIRNEESK